MEEDLSKVLSEQDSSHQSTGVNETSHRASPPQDPYRRGRSASPKHSSSLRMRTPYERPPPSAPSVDYRSEPRAPPPSDRLPPSSDYRDRLDRGYYSSREPVGTGYYSNRGMSDAKPVNRECRVYVGNLAYEVGWQELKEFMRKAGEVVYADVMTQPNGRSKGCGLVEFSTAEEAQRAIKELSDTPLMGRSVFIREDREHEHRSGYHGPSRYSGGGGRYGGYHGSYGDTTGRQVFVGNLPYIVSWQDLKDTFRQAGHIVRADVMEDSVTRRSKGTGTVLFETASEAQKAIGMEC